MALVDLARLLSVFGSAPRPPFLGALVSKTSSQAILTGTGTFLVWHAAEYDDGGWLGSSGDNFLTVPAGVSRIRVVVGVTWSDAADGTTRTVQLRKNSISFPGNPALVLTPLSVNMFAASPVVDVVPTDVIQVRVLHDSVAPSINVTATNTTFFGIEAVR